MVYTGNMSKKQIALIQQGYSPTAAYKKIVSDNARGQITAEKMQEVADL